MRKILVAATLSAAILAPSVSNAQGLEPFEAYFVFVGATKSGATGPKGREIERAARKCGFNATSDFSFKFNGKEGMDVYFLEDYFSPEVHGKKAKGKAEAVLAKVKKCIPDAYVKKTWYSGE